MNNITLIATADEQDQPTYEWDQYPTIDGSDRYGVVMFRNMSEAELIAALTDDEGVSPESVTPLPGYAGWDRAGVVWEACHFID